MCTKQMLICILIALHFSCYIAKQIFGGDATTELFTSASLETFGIGNDFDCMDFGSSNNMSSNLRMVSYLSNVIIFYFELEHIN